MYDLYFLFVRIIGIYQFLVFLYVLLGWLHNFGALPYSRPMMTVIDILSRLCEPALQLVRGILPAMGGLDFSPVVVIFGLELVKMLLRQLLFM